MFPHSLFLATEGQWSTLLYFLSKKTLHQLLNNYNSLMSGNEIFKRLLFLHISWHLTTMKSFCLLYFCNCYIFSKEQQYFLSLFWCVALVVNVRKNAWENEEQDGAAAARWSNTGNASSFSIDQLAWILFLATVAVRVFTY